MPQLLLNVVLISNNVSNKEENDIYFGIPIHMSIILGIFSFGSLVIGFKKKTFFEKNLSRRHSKEKSVDEMVKTIGWINYKAICPNLWNLIEQMFDLSNAIS